MGDRTLRRWTVTASLPHSPPPSPPHAPASVAPAPAPQLPFAAAEHVPARRVAAP